MAIEQIKTDVPEETGTPIGPWIGLERALANAADVNLPGSPAALLVSRGFLHELSIRLYQYDPER